MAIWIVGAERFAVERFGVGKGRGALGREDMARLCWVLGFVRISGGLVVWWFGRAKGGTFVKKLEGIGTNRERIARGRSRCPFFRTHNVMLGLQRLLLDCIGF